MQESLPYRVPLCNLRQPPARPFRGVLLPAKVDQAAGHMYAVVKYERLLPDGHLSGRSGRVRDVLARSETVSMSGQLTNTNVQTARGVISVEGPRVMLVRSHHGPRPPTLSLVTLQR